MASWIRKTWHDPVGSKVIAASLLALAGSLASSTVRDLVSDLFSRAGSLLVSACRWLTVPETVSRSRLQVLAYFAAGAAIFCVIPLVRSLRQALHNYGKRNAAAREAAVRSALAARNAEVAASLEAAKAEIRRVGEQLAERQELAVAGGMPAAAHKAPARMEVPKAPNELTSLEKLIIHTLGSAYPQSLPLQHMADSFGISFAAAEAAVEKLVRRRLLGVYLFEVTLTITGRDLWLSGAAKPDSPSGRVEAQR